MVKNIWLCTFSHTTKEKSHKSVWSPALKSTDMTFVVLFLETLFLVWLFQYILHVLVLFGYLVIHLFFCFILSMSDQQ